MNTDQRRPCGNRQGLRRRLGSLAAVGLILTCSVPRPASAAEYVLSAGDVLELSVVGVPELSRRGTVGIDGRVYFPLVGDVQASGRTLNTVRSDVQSALTQQPLRRQNPMSGEPTVYNIGKGEVSVQIAEFRPVYVNGDVARPGQVTYVPGLTVRQAVAISGGFGRDRSEGTLIELQTRYNAAALAFVDASLRVRRIKTELGRSDSALMSDLPDIDATMLASMTADQDQQLKAHEAELQTKHNVVREALAQSAHRMEVLQNQASNEDVGADLDAADVARVDALFHKGIVPATRVTEVRRSGLLASSRALQTRVALEDARREHAELVAKEGSLDSDRMLELLRELEDVTPRMNDFSVHMQGLQRQMAFEGYVQTGIEIVVFRKSDVNVQRMAADEDFELLPGDTINVVISRQPKRAAKQLGMGP